MLRRLAPDGSPPLASLLAKSGEARVESGDLEGAVTDFEEASRMAEKFLWPAHPDIEEYRAALESCRRSIEDGGD